MDSAWRPQTSMDTAWKAYARSLPMKHFQPDKVPWRRMGQYLYRIVEDGSSTQMRFSAIESLLPPHSNGPVFHFHEMHDECFLIKTGIVRFHCPGRPDIDAKAGDMVSVPTRLPHRFSNPFDEDAVFVNLNSPGFYVRYFEHLEEMIGKGRELTPEVNRKAMMRFATVPLMPEEAEAFARECVELGDGVTNGETNGETNGIANGELTNEETNGTVGKKAAAAELDVASNGGKGVFGYGIRV